MLATLVIGLREGLEASLIVGIIAAFLKQSNRPDALRAVWAGVGAAVAVCLAVGVGLQAVSSGLPQRQQEMLECVVAAIAVAMITYMVLWMRAHSRGLKADLQNAAGGALARGSAAALVVMAFLAVIREGFETAVFLLAAFQSTVSPVQAAIGVVLGIALAVGLGYLIYRGGVRLNLSRFFRITGVVLVLVAAGLVMSTLRAAYEAGWLTVGQQTAVDLTAVSRPGSVQESLLTGMLGIRGTLPVVEVVAYLLYAVPLLAVVLWPPSRTPARRTVGVLLTAVAGGALAVALLLAVLAPATPGWVDGAQGPFTLADAAGTVGGTAVMKVDSGVASMQITADVGGLPMTGTSTLVGTGHTEVADGWSATRFAGSPISSTPDAAAAGLQQTLTQADVAALNGGRLPVGLGSGGRSGDTAMPASYTDTATPTITIDRSTGTVLGLDLRLVRTVQVTAPSGVTVSVGTESDSTLSTTPAAVAASVAGLLALQQQKADSELLGTVLPGLLVAFAIVLLAFGIPRRAGRRGAGPDPAVLAPPAAESAESQHAEGTVAQHLTSTGPSTPRL